MTLIKDPTEQKLDPKDTDIDNAYIALGKSTEFWIVVGRGSFAFRFGPYEGKECGPILERAIKERIAVTVVGQCGREFDWEIAKDMGMRLVLPGDRKSLWSRIKQRFGR